MNNNGCVPVYRDDLESEALMLQCIQSTLAIIRAATDRAASDYSCEVSNTCYLLKSVMDTRADILCRMAKGEFTGPKTGGAA